jgi:hypothetical protein
MTVLAATGQEVHVRDFGLLSSAVARPGASAFGEEAYPDPWEKAAALLHSLTRNHPFWTVTSALDGTPSGPSPRPTRSDDSQPALTFTQLSN